MSFPTQTILCVCDSVPTTPSLCCVPRQVMWQGLRGKSSLEQISFQCSSSLLSGFISSPWCIPFMDHHRECTCSLLGASLYTTALKWVIILISSRNCIAQGAHTRFHHYVIVLMSFQGFTQGSSAKQVAPFTASLPGLWSHHR